MKANKLLALNTWTAFCGMTLRAQNKVDSTLHEVGVADHGTRHLLKDALENYYHSMFPED